MICSPPLRKAQQGTDSAGASRLGRASLRRPRLRLGPHFLPRAPPASAAPPHCSPISCSCLGSLGQLPRRPSAPLLRVLPRPSVHVQGARELSCCVLGATATEGTENLAGRAALLPLSSVTVISLGRQSDSSSLASNINAQEERAERSCWPWAEDTESSGRPRGRHDLRQCPGAQSRMRALAGGGSRFSVGSTARPPDPSALALVGCLGKKRSA